MESQQILMLLDGARSIAGQAGQAVLEVYRGAIEVEVKDDRSPLTAADRASHDLIHSGLSRLEPRFPMLSEESPPERVGERRDWQTYWLVDPLDGTKEFIKRNGEFTVNIALIHGTKPLLGVVLAPALDLEYSAARGLGAWKRDANGNRGRIRVSEAATPVRVVGSRSHPSAGLADYLRRLGPHSLQPMGSSLKICLVAEGRADVYPRLGPTCEWDTAAAQAILESAGGGMIDLVGQPLRYNKDDLINPYFVAFGDHGRNWLAAFESGSGSEDRD
jgi:3'(2'), 5'-bisphosphate nucleotidase